MSTPSISELDSLPVLDARPTAEGGEAKITGSAWKLAAYVFVENRLAVAGLGVVVFMFLFCFIGPLIYHTDQINTDITQFTLPPSAAHPLGTDNVGYDVLGRLMVGGQTSLEIGIIAALLATTFGVLWGAIAGFVGGWLDQLMMRIVDSMLAIPTLFLLLVLAAMFVQLRMSMQEFTRIANDLQGRVDPILLRVNRILEDSEERISSVMGDTAEITRIARGQAQKVDRVVSEALERLRIQVIRADQILTGALEVVDEAGTKFRNTLWRPIRQASAVMKGIKVGLDILRRQQNNKPESDPVSQDEELFI